MKLLLYSLFVLMVQKSTIILLLDASKAFDRVNRNFLWKIMEKFGFGQSLITWIKLLYSGSHSRVCTNGFLTDKIYLERGVRQGCPLSPLLYIIFAECLATSLRKDKDIKGFLLPNGKETKLKSYADDMSSFVRDIDSIHNIFKLLNDFGQASESKLNRDKTRILPCGSLRGLPNIDELPDFSNKIKVLGAWVGSNQEEICDLNWNPVITKIVRSLNMWKQRNLTILGKTTVINCIALSKLWYLGTVLRMPQEKIYLIEKEVYSFLWNGKRSRVNKFMVQCQKDTGGLHVPNIKLKIMALKLQWFTKMMSNKPNDQNDTSILVRYFIENFDQTFQGLQVLTTSLLNVRNNRVPPIYQDIFEAWKNLGLERKWANTKRGIGNEFLWLNPFLQWNDHSTYDLDWIRKGITQIRDLWDNDRNTWHTPEYIANKVYQHRGREFIRQIRKKIDTLKSLLPEEITDRLANRILEDDGERNTMIQDLYVLNKLDYQAKKLYARLLLKENPFVTRTEINFRDIHGIEPDLASKLNRKWWNTLWKSKAENKMKEIQWKITHNCIVLNDILKEWDLIDHDECTFCHDNTENLKHIILECNITKAFWTWVFDNRNVRTNLDEEFMYYNGFNSLSEADFIITMCAKYALVKCRNMLALHSDTPMNPTVMLKATFNASLRSTLETIYHKHQIQHLEQNFIEKYTGNGIVIADGKIFINSH